MDWLIERMEQWKDQHAIIWRNQEFTYGQILDRFKYWEQELDSYKSLNETWIKKAADFSALDNKVLARKEATREELINEIKNLNQFHEEIYSGIIDLRFSLLELTNEEEWDLLLKEMDKMLKKQSF